MKAILQFTSLRLFSLLMILGVAFSACTEDEPEVYGDVHGFVSDEATGEPIRTASVTINPGGKKTVTGSDGRFEYNALEAGQYTLQIAKDGYQTNVGNVTVIPGQTAQCDILLRPGDGYLKINKSEINLGTTNNMGAFEISNTGKIDLQWTIKKDCDWITEIDPSTGTTASGKKSSVTVKIDRSKLEAGKNYSYAIIITSNAGAADLTILASGAGAGEDPEDPDTPGQPGTGEHITAGLMAYYTFNDSNGNDATDNKSNSILINSPEFVTLTPSGSGKALFLNGTKKQFMNIPYNLFKGLYTYSYSIWVKDFGSGYLLTTIEPTNIYKYDYPRFFAENDGLFYLTTVSSIYSGSTSKYSYPYKNIQDEKWHHIVFTVSGSEYTKGTNKLYIDGQLVDSSSAELRPSTDKHTKIQIGGNADDRWTGYSASMKVDNIRFYNRVLNDNEVQAIYNYEKAE